GYRDQSCGGEVDSSRAVARAVSRGSVVLDRELFAVGRKLRGYAATPAARAMTNAAAGIHNGIPPSAASRRSAKPSPSGSVGGAADSSSAASVASGVGVAG